ncbi:helix-turn-helix transcriptional regulator [Pseudomonas aeruginosa]|nr:helix-turn-helix transcriptional regulator [Pseudomonas aeruginosa]MDF5990474.1 helix-turn-helix transcriptional regulator [Pseudomonas aeruginosa]
MDRNLPDGPPKALGQYFSDNLCAVLAVAGKPRDNGTAGPITATRIQRETGVARSTLRALKSQRGEVAANPDLDTLDRIADVLGVPPAFLLMRPQDWVALANAMGSINDYLAAAVKLHNDGQLDFGSPVEKVLRECKVHPDARPMGLAPLQRSSAQPRGMNGAASPASSSMP